jgi:hypothetical protein
MLGVEHPDNDAMRVAGFSPVALESRMGASRRAHAPAPSPDSAPSAPPTSSPGESRSPPSTTEHDRASGLQMDCSRRLGRGVYREESLRVTGGRTWIRTTDLFPIRQAVWPAHLGPGKPRASQAVTRTVSICRETLGPNSQRVPTRAIADRAFGLQIDCRRRASRVMPGMQDEAAEEIDAGLRAALAG